MLNLTTLEIAVYSALLSLFLDFCFRDGNILDFWIKFLLVNTFGRKFVTDFLEVGTREELEELAVHENKWLKPLGLCVVCYNFWITLGLCAVYDHPSLLAVLLSSFIVRIAHGRLL